MATRKDPTDEVLETIAAMTDRDRAIAERLHEVITSAAPELSPRLWHKQPAYAVTEVDDAVADRIAAPVRRAVSGAG